jgi:maltooligosyltrehalose trehalohydrolase
MHRFRVWAPKAQRVAVGIGETKYPMKPAGGGWWEAAVDAAGPGTDYAYFLDEDSLALPDPRSLWQPHGVHAPSRVFDPGSFAWSDAAWQLPPLASGIVYELHIGSSMRCAPWASRTSN